MSQQEPPKKERITAYFVCAANAHAWKSCILCQCGSARSIWKNTRLIDRFYKWRQKNYSLVYVLIRPTSVVLKEHLFCMLSVLTRLVSLISTKTIEHFFWPPFMQSVYNGSEP